MSAFYVGQRVRLARPLHPENSDKEGVITELGLRIFAWNGFANCCVRWDSPVTGNYSHTNQLEPILPAGMELLEETLALWLPEAIAWESARFDRDGSYRAPVAA